MFRKDVAHDCLERQLERIEGLRSFGRTELSNGGGLALVSTA
jgi:hypothetical protein